MHTFVQRIVRGVVFCSVCIAVVACAGHNDLAERNAAKNPVAQSEEGLPRIDAIRLRVARNALENGDYNTAIRFFESVRNSSPDHPAAILGIAQANMAAGSYQEAIVAYQDVLEMDSDNQEALDGIGRALVLTANYRDAIKFFDRLLAEAPSAALHNRLGVAYDLMGDGASAQEHYREALKLDPEAISPRNNLALSLAISEHYAEAIKQMERVAAHPQATARHRQNLAFVYGMAGENNTAAAAFSENGLTPAEIAKKRALYKRLRELAREGKHAEILEYLRNGKDISGSMMADSMSEPPPMPDGASDLASIAPDMSPPAGDAASMGDTAPTGKGLSSKPLADKEFSPRSTAPKPTRMAKRRESAQAAPKRARRARRTGRATPFLNGVYRVQLAAYRTARTAIRGVKILHSMLKDLALDLDILVRQKRSQERDAIDYRIRTTQLPGKDAAQTVCNQVRTAGFPDCLVILHNPRVWLAVNYPGAGKVAREAAAPEITGSGVYRLQLASYRTKRNAVRGQAILRKLLGDRAVELDVMVKQPKQAGPTAFNYQVRTGPIESRTQANTLCGALRKAGHRGCLVVRHNALLWKNLASAAENNHASADGAAPGSPSPDTPADRRQAALPALRVLQMPGAAGDTAQAGASRSWRLQLASYRSERAAAKGLAVLRKKLGDRPVGLEILVKRTKKGGPAAFNYQIRTSPIESRTEGNSVCDALRKAGHTGCLIVRHNGRLWQNLASAGGRKRASVTDKAARGLVKPSLANSGRIRQSLKDKGRVKATTTKVASNSGAMNDAAPANLAALPGEASEPTYRLQIASYRTERDAVKGQAVLEKMLAGHDVKLEIMVRRGRSEQPSALDYQIRSAPLESLSAGADLCRILKKAGHKGCFVVKHNDDLWQNLADATTRDRASLILPADADPADLIIELPSAIVMEAGHDLLPDRADADEDWLPDAPMTAPAAERLLET